jgi:hypothetical protein
MNRFPRTFEVLSKQSESCYLKPQGIPPLRKLKSQELTGNNSHNPLLKVQKSSEEKLIFICLLAKEQMDHQAGPFPITLKLLLIGSFDSNLLLRFLGGDPSELLELLQIQISIKHSVLRE